MRKTKREVLEGFNLNATEEINSISFIGSEGERVKRNTIKIETNERTVIRWNFHNIITTYKKRMDNTSEFLSADGCPLNILTLRRRFNELSNHIKFIKVIRGKWYVKTRFGTYNFVDGMGVTPLGALFIIDDQGYKKILHPTTDLT